jgi:excisionase family DNA binding protein
MKPGSDTRRGEARFLTVPQVAERWQVSEKKVRRLISSGDLIAHRFGVQIRVSEADLIGYERINRQS